MEDNDPRQRILEAALAAVRATGPSVVSMRQIAERAGVAVGTVTYHFPDKQDLLEECLDELYASLDSLWDGVPGKMAVGGPNRSLATHFLNGLFDTLRGQRNLLRLRVLLAMDRGHVPRKRLIDHLVRYVDEVEEVFDIPRRQLALRFHAVYVMYVRHCAMHLEEWQDLTGETNPEAATNLMRDHLLDVALGVLDLRA